MKYPFETIQMTDIKLLRSNMREDSVTVVTQVESGAVSNDPYQRPASDVPVSTVLIASVAWKKTVVRDPKQGGAQITGDATIVFSRDDKATLDGQLIHLEVTGIKLRVIETLDLPDTNEYMAFCQRI